MSSIIQGLTRGIRQITGSAVISDFIKAGGNWSHISIRTNVRNYFPKPREVKRIKVHGWKKRMSTPEGKKVLMRRILKGRHVLSH